MISQLVSFGVETLFGYLRDIKMRWFEIERNNVFYLNIKVTFSNFRVPKFSNSISKLAFSGRLLTVKLPAAVNFINQITTIDMSLSRNWEQFQAFLKTLICRIFSLKLVRTG